METAIRTNQRENVQDKSACPSPETGFRMADMLNFFSGLLTCTLTAVSSMCLASAFLGE